MYLEHWQLNRKPFENSPDPDFLFASKKHEEALLRMLYLVREQKGAGVITGEVGAGKTLLSRVLLQELAEDEKYHTAIILNPKLSAEELTKEIIYQLGEEPPPGAGKSALLRLLNDILYKNKKWNKTTVIIIDEAQAIEDKDSFEELRLLLNFQLNDGFLLTLILLGQPELRDKIRELPQLKQRLSLNYHLNGLEIDETEKYISYRMNVAGAGRNHFLPEAISLVHTYSKGIPRRINNLCDLALLTGFGSGAAAVNQKIIHAVARDLDVR
ncbi:ExeA family protein [Candidatus Margulisiibacteriota bacterium]